MRVAIVCLVAGLFACGGSSLPSAEAVGDDGGSGGDAGAEAAGDDAGTAGEGGACGAGVIAAPGMVVTDRGAVQGMSEGGTWAFLGIPYAAAPVGSLRWAAPQTHDCWASTRDATAFGAMCPQVDPADTTKVLGQEDCLTINVWAPSSATAGSKLPVLFFIHGGGNVQGSASDKGAAGAYVYDGAALAAKQNAVVVTFQYRLGVLGFLAHPAFGANPGNYGTLDQIFALGWVQRNVAAFGGDPARVLVFGQSAGAEDVCNMVASPLAKGLFAAALMESGGCTARPLATAETFAHSWAQKVSCDAAADPAGCMRALDVTAVLENMPEPASVAGARQGDYEPDVDGVALPDASDKIIAAGKHNHVPFVIGSNSDETALEIAKSPQGMAIKTDADYQAAVLAYAGGNQTLASAIVAQYPSASYPTPLEAYIQVTTDAKFTCGARYAARQALKGQSDAPVWRYFYTHHLDGNPVTAAEKALGAWHGQELGMVFRDYGGSYMPSSGETALEDAMGAAWTSLAAGGTPGAAWPQYTTSDPYTQLDDMVTTGTGVRTTLCDFWDMVLGR